MDWDDLKIFLAVARKGSVRGAAKELNVNQSTVSRRMSAFESTINTKLFEKLPSGYKITESGAKILENARIIEQQVFAIDRNLFSQKDELTGALKIALPVPLATNMLMPAMSDFTQAYPSIKLDLAVSANPTNLSKRETDIAIRIIKVGETPPPYLVGRKLVTYVEAVYVARKMLNKNVNWLVDNEEEKMPHWLCQSDISKVDSCHSVDHLIAKFAAVKAGFGMAILPCCFGDADDDLVRVPSTNLSQGREIWLLNHIDMKDVVRVQVFKKFIRAYFDTQKDLLEGRLPKA